MQCWVRYYPDTGEAVLEDEAGQEVFPFEPLDVSDDGPYTMIGPIEIGDSQGD